MSELMFAAPSTSPQGSHQQMNLYEGEGFMAPESHGAMTISSSMSSRRPDDVPAPNVPCRERKLYTDTVKSLLGDDSILIDFVPRGLSADMTNEEIINLVGCDNNKATKVKVQLIDKILKNHAAAAKKFQVEQFQARIKFFNLKLADESNVVTIQHLKNWWRESFTVDKGLIMFLICYGTGISGREITLHDYSEEHAWENGRLKLIHQKGYAPTTDLEKYVEVTKNGLRGQYQGGFLAGLLTKEKNLIRRRLDPSFNVHNPVPHSFNIRLHDKRTEPEKDASGNKIVKKNSKKKKKKRKPGFCLGSNVWYKGVAIKDLPSDVHRKEVSMYLSEEQQMEIWGAFFKAESKSPPPPVTNHVRPPATMVTCGKDDGTHTTVSTYCTMSPPPKRHYSSEIERLEAELAQMKRRAEEAERVGKAAQNKKRKHEKPSVAQNPKKKKRQQERADREEEKLKALMEKAAVEQSALDSGVAQEDLHQDDFVAAEKAMIDGEEWETDPTKQKASRLKGQKPKKKKASTVPRTKTATKKTVPAKKKVPKSSAVSKDPQEDSDPRNMGTENEVTVVKHKITDSGNKIRYDCAFKDGLGTSKDLEPIKVCLDSPSKIIRYCERHPIAAELTCKNLMGHFDNDPQKLLKKKGERTKVINCHDAIKKIAKDYRGSQKAKADEEAAKQKKQEEENKATMERCTEAYHLDPNNAFTYEDGHGYVAAKTGYLVGAVCTMCNEAIGLGKGYGAVHFCENCRSRSLLDPTADIKICVCCDNCKVAFDKKRWEKEAERVEQERLSGSPTKRRKSRRLR